MTRTDQPSAGRSASTAFDCGPAFRSGILRLLCGICISIVAGYASLSDIALAAQVTFAWDYSDSRADGFYLHCGPTTGSYDTTLNVGTTTSATVAGLTEGVRRYCVVTAYDGTVESDPSNEVIVIPTAAPNLVFGMSTTSGMAPLTVTFTNTTGGQITGWQWDFGDGSGSTLQSPSHVYSTPGRYTVVLTASGTGGSVSKTAATSIVVSSQSSMLNAVRTAIGAVIEKPPTAAFTPSSTSGTAPFKVTLANTTTGASSFMWDFGDSTFSNERSPVHTYLAAGTYTARLTAAGPAGTGSTSTTAQITVSAAPAASAAQNTVTTTSTTTLTTAGASVTTFSGGCSAGTLLGDTTLGTDDQSAAGVATAFSTKATFCGTLAALSVFLESTSTATKLNVGLYSDASGHPGTLLVQGSTSSPSPGAWNTVSISPTSVTAGGAYWIAILGTQAGTVHFDTKAGSSCSREMSAQSNLTALPTTWTTGSFDPQAACQVSAYGSSPQ